VQRSKLGGIPNWGRNRAVKTNRLVFSFMIQSGAQKVNYPSVLKYQWSTIISIES